MALSKKLVIVAAVALAAVVLFAAFYELAKPEQDTLYQVSPFNVFSAGNFEGNTTYAELARHGDFGIGTVNGLDGEMFALNGKFYQIPTDGAPREIGPSEMTPYATVTFFNIDRTFHIANVFNFSELTADIDSMLPDHSAIYAIKVIGHFDFAKTRSVPLQTKPFPTLNEAVKNQTVFNLDGVDGTAVGFFFPESMNGIDFVGYHLHFLADDRAAGGHLLDCTIGNATVEIDQTNDFHLLIA
jgi:acetolactate decarboxylase